MQAALWPYPWRATPGKLTLKAFTTAGDPACRIVPSLLASSAIGTETASDRSMETARIWLANCLRGHVATARSRSSSSAFRAVFPSPRPSSGQRPTRLVDCFADCPFIQGGGSDLTDSAHTIDEPASMRSRGYGRTCRLVEVTDHDPPYAALSYRWGIEDPTSWITTIDNLETRLLVLNEHSLSRTLFDAVNSTRRLHIRYLWIDALCIVQQSKADWLTESAKMGTIFGRAMVTLCADSSPGSQGELSNQKSISGFKLAAANLPDYHFSSIRSTLSDGQISTLHVKIRTEDGHSN
jgi:hypothetical protein